MARTSRKKNIEESVQAVAPSQVFPTAIYARLSVENSGKDDDGAALENQIAVCEEYIKTCPYLQLIETYSDNGRTGTVFDRPAFNRLMDDIRGGRIRCLVVRDLSRFGRDYVETGTYIERIFPQLDRFLNEPILTYEMAHAFVEAVYIYPDGTNEICWKFKNFTEGNPEGVNQS